VCQVHEKLRGIHNNIQLSESGHVRKLIQEALDIDNLALLFEGWQAWL
jgi:hypothetical protein